MTTYAPTTKRSRSDLGGGVLQLPNGRPSLEQKVRREEIVRMTIDEIHDRLITPEKRVLIEMRDLVLVAKTLDPDLRVTKAELAVREPLKIIVSRESGL